MLRFRVILVTTSHVEKLGDCRIGISPAATSLNAKSEVEARHRDARAVDMLGFLRVVLREVLEYMP